MALPKAISCYEAAASLQRSSLIAATRDVTFPRSFRTPHAATSVTRSRPQLSGVRIDTMARLDIEDVIDELRSSIVQITWLQQEPPATGPLGTGFFVSAEGHVI